MKKLAPNLFDLPDPLPETEQFDTLVQDKGVHIERIISAGQNTPDGEWYDQVRDEWVLLIQGRAEISYEDGEATRLGPGDHVLIPAHKRHRVQETSIDPPCIWLAVHARML
jgi:cupin 2 domain-containing protein